MFIVVILTLRRAFCSCSVAHFSIHCVLVEVKMWMQGKILIECYDMFVVKRWQKEFVRCFRSYPVAGLLLLP